ncbi:MAG: nitroreductase family protein [Candidatus Woesearchaeota archaeon]
MDANGLMGIIKERRSIRQFADKDVPEDIVKDLVDAARWAPSACNLQHWLFVSVRNPRLKKEIADKGRVQKQILNAPVIMAVFCNMEASPENMANVQSVSAAITNILLYAHSLGLGANWVCGFDNPEEIRKLLNVPRKYKAIAILMLGYPKEGARIVPPPRIPVSDILFNEKYSKDEEDFPSTVNVKNWSTKQLATYQEVISRRGFEYELINEDKINEIFSYVKPKLKGENIMDYNSFSGLFLSRMQKIGPKVYGQFMTEPVSVAACMYNKELSNSNFVFGYDGVAKKGLDVITSFYRLEHAANITSQLNMFNDALKPKGKAIIVVRNNISWRGLLDFYQIKLRNKSRISSRFFLGLQHMGPWRLLTRRQMKLSLQRAGFADVKIHGKYVFPYSEIVNTATFEAKFRKVKPLLKLVKLLDDGLEKIGIANYIGETLIFEAAKK